MTTTIRRHHHHHHHHHHHRVAAAGAVVGDNASTCSSLESLANSENRQLWADLQSRDRLVAQLRSAIAELEPAAASARAEAAQLDMINVRRRAPKMSL